MVIPPLARTPLVQCAAAWGMGRRTCYNLLKGLRDKELAAGKACRWWLQNGPRGEVFVNMSRLMAAHADHFPALYPNREEFEALGDRVDELEEQLETMSKRTLGERDGNRSQLPSGGNARAHAGPRGVGGR